MGIALGFLGDGFQGLVVQCYFAATGLNDEIRIGVLCDFLYSSLWNCQLGGFHTIRFCRGCPGFYGDFHGVGFVFRCLSHQLRCGFLGNRSRSFGYRLPLLVLRRFRPGFLDGGLGCSVTAFGDAGLAVLFRYHISIRCGWSRSHCTAAGGRFCPKDDGAGQRTVVVLLVRGKEPCVGLALLYLGTRIQLCSFTVGFDPFYDSLNGCSQSLE